MILGNVLAWADLQCSQRFSSANEWLEVDFQAVQSMWQLQASLLQRAIAKQQQPQLSSAHTLKLALAPSRRQNWPSLKPGGHLLPAHSMVPQHFWDPGTRPLAPTGQECSLQLRPWRLGQLPELLKLPWHCCLESSGPAGVGGQGTAGAITWWQ